MTVHRWQCFDNLIAMASNLLAITSPLVAMAFNLLAMASIFFVQKLRPTTPAVRRLDGSHVTSSCDLWPLRAA